MDPNECGPNYFQRSNSKDPFIAIDATCNKAACSLTNTLFGETFVEAEIGTKEERKKSRRRT